MTLVSELIGLLQNMPQDKHVEILIPADEPLDDDQEPSNIDDLYADNFSVYVKGDVVVIKGN